MVKRDSPLRVTFTAGFYTGGGDHWFYNRSMEGSKVAGHDLHDDTAERLSDVHQYDGTYSAELFTARAQQLIRRRDKRKVGGACGRWAVAPLWTSLPGSEGSGSGQGFSPRVLKHFLPQSQQLPRVVLF